MRSLLLVFLLIPILSSCGEQSAEGSEDDLSRDYVSVDAEKADVLDSYLELDSRALIGVDKNAAVAALAGNRYIARTIGNEFASANHASEARFWFQIAAENGDGIAMQNLSLALRSLSCARANYWLKKALATNHLGKRSRASIQKDLEKYETDCPKTTQVASSPSGQ